MSARISVYLQTEAGTQVPAKCISNGNGRMCFRYADSLKGHIAAKGLSIVRARIGNLVAILDSPTKILECDTLILTVTR